ncbi:MAG: hypothetical protein P1U77_00650 [Rubripirellula sp.]|jgi:hypothetical protein|nr:hypothetical protein [Rubripirellula sp.]
MTIDSQDRIASHTGFMQMPQIDLTLVNDIKQRLTGQFDEIMIHSGIPRR